MEENMIGGEFSFEIVKKIAPNVFKNAGAPCVRGKCTEGKMTCGNPRKDV